MGGQGTATAFEATVKPASPSPGLRRLFTARAIRKSFGSRQDQPDASGLGLVGIGERMCSLENEARPIQRREIDGGGITLCEVQHAHQGSGDSVLGESFQCHQIVVAVDRWYDDSALARRDEFGI